MSLSSRSLFWTAVVAKICSHCWRDLMKKQPENAFLVCLWGYTSAVDSEGKEGKLSPRISLCKSYL